MRRLTELEKRIDEHRENFNKVLENIEKNHPELRNTITEIKKKKTEGINNRVR